MINTLVISLSFCCCYLLLLFFFCHFADFLRIHSYPFPPLTQQTDQEGSTECLPCGHLVNATEDRQDCDVQCIYYNIDTNHTYDVTPLSARFSVNDGMGLRYVSFVFVS